MISEVAKSKVTAKTASFSFVVGIGASAGGLGALRNFFTYLPKDFGEVIVLIPHLSPDYESHMKGLLEKYTVLPITEVVRPTKIQKGHVYLLTPNKMLALEGDTLVPQPRRENSTGNNVIDYFFYSLAHACQDKAIAIILSGTGSDGSTGAAAINSFGGTVLVQKPDEAQFDGMPMAAIMNKMATHVLPSDRLGQKLYTLVSEDSKKDSFLETVLQNPDVVDLIIAQIKSVTTSDYSGYKKSTIVRRISRRLAELGKNDLSDYLEFIKNNPDEAQWLSEDLLIGVTSFFRDPMVWEHLEEQTIPKLIQKAKNGDTLRMWCIGCSTGQEAYSLAMTTKYLIKKSDKVLGLKIFASDLSKNRIDVASKGLYANAFKKEVPKKYHKYFQEIDGNRSRIIREVREALVFNHHNSLSGPHISKMHLVMCRNMLIYLEEHMQRKMLEVFRFALNVGGYLVLGLSEGLLDHSAFFPEENRRLKVFKNLSKTPFYLATNLSGHKKPHVKPKKNNQPLKTVETVNYDFLPNFLNDTLINELDVAAIYINKHGQILKASGGFRKFLELPAAGFSNNIFDLIPLSFQATLREAISAALKEDEKVKIENINLPGMPKDEAVNILISPYQSDFLPSNSELLLVFLPQRAKPEKTVKIEHKEGTERDSLVIRLQNELKKAHDELAVLKNEVDVSGEELQTTNEELMVTNEELQSANEELQSVNEELHAVNDELSHKLNDLTAANDDIDNLLNGTLIDVLLVDKKIQVRRFTPNIKKHFSISEHFSGIPLSNFPHNFKGAGNDLYGQCKRVIATGKSHQKELQNNTGKWFLQRITPFINSEKKVDGAIVTYVDITELKNLYQSNKELERFAYVASHDLQEPLRNIMGFIGLFKKEYDHCFDENAHTYLDFIDGAADRMGTLIKDVLTYSRIGVRDVDQPVDLAETLENVLHDLQRNIDEKKAVVKVGEMPVVNGHPIEFYSLFLNLIGNGLKFGSADKKPKIVVGSKKIARFYQFSVADNGVGISEEHMGKVFDIFKRFHDTADYKGTGIGLAHCKKIVELHGGSIWVESKVGKGSTFHFTIKA